MLYDTESYTRLRAEVRSAVGATDGDRNLRFLVVDDSAGTDADVATLQQFDDVEVLTPPFSLADDDVVVTMDSDGEDQPADVPRLLAALHSSGAALVLAERTKRSEPLLFRVLYVLFRVFFRVIAGITVLSGNFAAQRGDSLKATISHPSFDLCYSSTLLALRRSTERVPCARGSRFAGRSRMNTSSLIAHGIRMLLPFSERIAARMLVIAATAFIAFVTVLVLVGAGVITGTAAIISTSVVAVLFATGFLGFLVLFSSFSKAPTVATKGPSPA